MELPGAKMSLQVPKLLKEERELELVVEPTVMASATNAGEKLHVSAFELPAATTTTIPALVAAPMAVVYAGSEPLPPRLMLMTEGFAPLVVIQSMADICHDRAPDP